MDEKIEYREGYPEDVGWYDVLVNGVEDRLLHRYCRSEQRHKWQNINGIEITDEVLWTGTAEAYP